MGLPEQQLEDAIVAAVDDGDEDDVETAVPVRVHTFFSDYPPAPALYAEFDVLECDGDTIAGSGNGAEDDGERRSGDQDQDQDLGDERTKHVPVIIHNFRYYPLGMDRWNLDFVDLLVMNELHELTHWAMTSDEREFFDERSRRYRRGDGYWLNPTLLEVIDWLPGEHTSVIEGTPTPSLGDRLRWWIGRVVKRLATGGR